jgi:uncharacterized protein (TIGR02466 family)
MAHQWADATSLNPKLKDFIQKQQRSSLGAAKTNVGGWHSEFGQLEFCGDAGKTLVRRMLDMADEATNRVIGEYGHAPRKMEWTLHAWANVNRQGDFNRIHTHPGSTWSGVYYVDTGTTGSDQGSTPLHLFDPCQGRANTFLPGLVASSFVLRPEPGLMILFPSYLAHMVFPHTGEAPRISIAFNLRREPFP